DSPLHGFSTVELPDSRTRAGPHAAFLERACFCVLASFVPRFGIWPDLAVAHCEVIKDRCGNDWNFSARGRIAGAMFFEITHDAVGRVETERAAAGENNRVHLIHSIRWLQKIRFTRAGCRTAHVDTRDRAAFVQDHGATGGPACIRKM